MTILERIMEQLQVREMHEIPSAMQKTLLDDNKRNNCLDALEPYYSYDAILAEFEKHSADRKNYMQDYTPRCILDIVAGITPIGRKVIDTCLQRTEIDAYSRRVRVNEIIDNDYNLNIPRYVDSFEPEPIPDAIELAKELNQINDESRKVGLELLTILKELVCTNPINAKEHEEFVSEFEKFLTSADGAVTVAEQEVVVAKLQEVKRYLLNKIFV